MIGIVAVVPADHVASLQRKGWVAGRQNGITCTMIHTYDTESEAQEAASKLPRSVTWNIEHPQ